MDSKPRISIIIFVDSLNPVLSDTLKGYARQTCLLSAFELIVVDFKLSRDFSAEVEKICQLTDNNLNIKYFRHESNSRSVRNNFGVTQATADLLVFISGDFIPQPGFIEAHLQFHQGHPEPQLVGIGPGFSPKSQREKSKFLAWQEDSGSLFGVRLNEKDPVLPKNFFYVANASIKKDFLLSVGMFDEDFPYDAWDDFEISMRLAQDGMESFYIPEAKAIHNHLVTLPERRKRIEWAGESAAILKSKYPDYHIPIRSPWKQLIKSYINLLVYGVTRNYKYQVNYWERTLETAFVRGYLRGCQALDISKN